jgi:flagellar biosynthesis protein FlhF
MDPLLLAQPAPARVETAAPPAVRELARRLLAHGASAAFARRVVARVEALTSRREGAHPLDLAAQAIGASFPRVVLSAPEAGPVALALLGARGAGRSALTRKLALRYRGAGRRVSVLAVRQPGSSKPEWLATWLQEQGVAARVVESGADAPRRALQSADVVLVDGCGDARRDRAVLEQLADGSAARLALTRLAVLAADSGPERLRADLRTLRALEPDCAVLTRLDLSAAPAAGLELAAEARVPVAFACDGARDEAHLHRLDPERAADVFLKGRIA